MRPIDGDALEEIVRDGLKEVPHNDGLARRHHKAEHRKRRPAIRGESFPRILGRRGNLGGSGGEEQRWRIGTSASRSAISAVRVFGMTSWVTSAGTPPRRMSGTTWSGEWGARDGRRKILIEKYFVLYKTRTNICFDCQNACGGCCWSEIDPITGKPRFQPVPGWKAKPSKLYSAIGTRKKRALDVLHHKMPTI